MLKLHYRFKSISELLFFFGGRGVESNYLYTRWESEGLRLQLTNLIVKLPFIFKHEITFLLPKIKWLSERNYQEKSYSPIFSYIFFGSYIIILKVINAQRTKISRVDSSLHSLKSQLCAHMRRDFLWLNIISNER